MKKNVPDLDVLQGGGEGGRVADGMCSMTLSMFKNAKRLR